MLNELARLGAYSRGRIAKIMGLSQHQCPFEEHQIFYSFWMEGFENAQKRGDLD